MSKEDIIAKIKSDAQAKAQLILDEQQSKADEILASAESECEQVMVETRRQIDEMTRQTLERAQSVAQLDAKRILLDARLEIIDRVFARALEKLTQLDDVQMRELLLNMLSEAEDGDEVLLNARGRALLSEADICAYAKKRKISLSLAQADGDFAGGLVLRKNGVDKNLTFEVELAQLRDCHETEIAKQIFG